MRNGKLHMFLASLPYGIAFSDLPKNRTGPKGALARGHVFAHLCRERHYRKLTKPYHPWTTDVIYLEYDRADTTAQTQPSARAQSHFDFQARRIIR
jgi:hypothetical protein